MTLLRESVDRLISAAFYTDLLAEKSLEALEDYLDRKHHHVGVDNAMTRLLSGRTALDPVAPEPDAITENFPRVGKADWRPPPATSRAISWSERPTSSMRR